MLPPQERWGGGVIVFLSPAESAEDAEIRRRELFCMCSMSVTK